MDYKKKYLKYKLKYLQAKQTFKGGMETPNKVSPPPHLTVTVATDTEEKVLTVLPTDAVHDAIMGAFRRRINEVLFKERVVEPNESFTHHGIEDKGSLIVTFKEKVPLTEIIEDIIKVNYHLNDNELRAELQQQLGGVGEGEDLHLDNILEGIQVLPPDDESIPNPEGLLLPESFCDLTVTGDLHLQNNNLTTLPASFGDLIVDGDLNLQDNNLTTLPETFGNLIVGTPADWPRVYAKRSTPLVNKGNIRLDNNKLANLPKSFDSLTVRGDLNLNTNELTSLPETFGNLTVGGTLDLSNNQLSSLPANFGSITVGINLYLNTNKLTSLPDSFSNLTLAPLLPKHGLITLYENQLTSLPKTFRNLKVKMLRLQEKGVITLPDSDKARVAVLEGERERLAEEVKEKMKKKFTNLV